MSSSRREMAMYVATAIGLPFVGDVRKNGLDTIRILKDYVIGKL